MSEQQRVAIVTGAAGGIGRELVLGLLGKRLKVAAVDRTAQGLVELAQAAQESNANLMPTTFSQLAVRSLRNRLPIARSTKCPRNPSCVGRL
jgi:NAD(P)-dependent dehydrogenase (short-subunit alcohol dehydrogenase family)